MNIKEIVKNNMSKIIVSMGVINLLVVILAFALLVFGKYTDRDSILYIVFCVNLFLAYYFWFFSSIPSIFDLTMSKWINKSWKNINIIINNLYIFCYVSFCIFAYCMSRNV